MYLAPKRPVTGTKVAASPAMARAWPATRAVTDSVVFGLISRMRKLLAFRRTAGRYGHFTSGGIDDRIESTLPPVFRPKMVPRSYSRLNST